ncbi:MAG: zinc metallopeptidase [Planctomycetales bacterium]|nr:zinc metallopeptidase [Planctomycetales bacterium]
MGFFQGYFSYLLFLSPAILLMLWAQFRIKTAYHAAMQQPAPISGAGAARHILDSAGLQNVAIEQVPGHLSDHYDPRDKVLRLSPEVYQSRTLAAVGIAAHEAGHALQDAKGYAPLAIRNAAVPAAGFGSSFGIILIIVGALLRTGPLIWAGIALFSCVVIFQVVNLPVEFNASTRAKQQLATLGIVSDEAMPYVRKVLSAAALTYVAATLQSILTLLYYITRFTGGSRN